MKITFLAISQKITFFLFLMTVVAASHGLAQSSRSKAPFVKGSKTIGFSVGFGVNYDYFGGYTGDPAVAVTYDQGIFENVGPGTIGIGGIFAIKNAHYYYIDGSKASWNNIILGVRGTYHLTLLKDKNNKFDPYGGVMFGLRIENFKNNYNAFYQSSTTVNPTAGIFVGAKYNFAEHFGAFAELGYDVSNFCIGLNVNF